MGNGWVTPKPCLCAGKIVSFTCPDWQTSMSMERMGDTSEQDQRAAMQWVHSVLAKSSYVQLKRPPSLGIAQNHPSKLNDWNSQNPHQVLRGVSSAIAKYSFSWGGGTCLFRKSLYQKGIDWYLYRYCLGHVQATMLALKHRTSSKTCPNCRKNRLIGKICVENLMHSCCSQGGTRKIASCG